MTDTERCKRFSVTIPLQISMSVTEGQTCVHTMKTVLTPLEDTAVYAKLVISEQSMKAA